MSVAAGAGGIRAMTRGRSDVSALGVGRVRSSARRSHYFNTLLSLNRPASSSATSTVPANTDSMHDHPDRGAPVVHCGSPVEHTSHTCNTASATAASDGHVTSCDVIIHRGWSRDTATPTAHLPSRDTVEQPISDTTSLQFVHLTFCHILSVSVPVCVCACACV